MLEKESLRERFGKSISHLFFCGNRGDSDVLAHVRSEEMVSLVDMLGPGAVLWIVCDFQCTTIILKNSAMNLCISGVHFVSILLLHFFQEPDNR